MKMSIGQRLQEQVNKKCLLLESMGFTINNSDFSVSFEGHEFDFSATQGDMWSIMYTVINTMHTKGLMGGRNEIRQGLKDLLVIEE